ncbi:MAG: hypothetical protein V1774_08650 [Candidatus Eisenbacteria bacterium]
MERVLRMEPLGVRCRQCGATAEIGIDAIPRYGARLRCEACGSLSALLLPPRSSAEESAPAQAPGRDGGGAAALESACDPTGVQEVRESLAPWLHSLTARSGAQISETILWSEHGAELARQFCAWRAAHPGPVSVGSFREGLFAAISRGARKETREADGGSAGPGEGRCAGSG